MGAETLQEIPPSMITLDMLLPPSHDVDTWGLLDVGQLGPALRFGLLSPAGENAGVSHWASLASRAGVARLVPAQGQVQGVQEHTQDQEGR